mmetsp:Transcript_83678/g.249737  ORF Transcript_83678/g.249737 Transcript_83678/m.249737 type:complete len:283 (-) Transcript_83678:2881-3729(-)
MPSPVGQRSLWTLTRDLADDVGDLLSRPDSLTPLHQPQGNLHMGLVLRIWVVLRILCQTLRDDIALERHPLLVHLLGLFRQVVVHPVHGVLLALLQHLGEHQLADLFCQPAPVAANNVKAFELPLERLLGPVHDLDCCVLLLLQQHQTGKHGIDLNFQPLVALVNGPLDVLRSLHGLVMIRSLRVDKDGIGVTIDNIQLQLLLHHGDRVLQRLPALGRDERSQRLRVEAAVLKAEAAVHGVGGELQRLLPDLERLQPLRVALRLDGGLDVPAALHKPAQHLW